MRTRAAARTGHAPRDAAKATKAAPAAGTGRLRMKDLCAATGLSRQAIHFYIQSGLLAEGEKTGRNMAWYGAAHVERVLLIRRLQEERFLPLRAIRALLSDDTTALPPPQQRLLAEIAARLPAELGGGADRTVRLADVVTRHGLDRTDVERLVALGHVPTRGHGSAREIPVAAERLLGLWAQWRTLGFTAARGFTVDDLAIFTDAVDRLVAIETRLLLERFGDLPADDAAPMLERALPLVHATLIHFHQTAVRAVFAATTLTAKTRGTP